MAPRPSMLVVEKDRKSRDRLCEAAKESGLRIFRALSWRRALDLLKKRYYDIIVLGNAGGRMDGVEMIRAVRKLGRDSCILVSFPFARSNKIIRCLKEGAYDNILQPVDAAWAAIQIRRAMERRNYYTGAQEKELYQKLSIYDELTRVYNHRYFHDSLARELHSAKRYRYLLSLLMMDLDDFKCYNDTNGHLAGDEALRKIGSLLPDSVRDGDIVARYGGDEFSVILPHTARKGARLMGERLRSMVEKARFKNEKKMPHGNLTISIGVATFPRDAVTKDELINDADMALYRAKRMGKNRVCSW